MTEENWDDFDEEAMDEMVRMFERMGMPVDVEVLRSLIKQVRNQFEQLGIDPKKVSMDEVKLGVDSDPEECQDANALHRHHGRLRAHALPHK